MIPTLLGGIGLFLLGMILMTSGLKSMAGESLRRILGRFTGGPMAALATGAAMTAVVQSSSATTLTIIGFVSAGLLTFAQSVGLIFGANIGTTSTSWIVAVLGLKLNVSAVALPLVGVGALMHLLGRGRVAPGGMALAGFGLIFVGIDTLQAGMQGMAAHVTPEDFPQDTLGGRMALVGLGAVMTVVMQSSSAAAATTLTALDTGAINLTQAACLVVGQNIGTTVKAALAAIGASVAARRTAVAHIVFNLATGVLAFAVLPLFVQGVHRVTEAAGQGDDAVSLAAFHTAFNVLGVALFLPFLGRYAAWVERLVPERRPALVRHLDRSVAQVGAVAVEAARRATRSVGAALVAVAQRRLQGSTASAGHALDEAEAAVHEVRRFLSQVSTTDDAVTHARHVSVLHALDHLERIAVACREPAAQTAAEDADLAAAAALLRQALAAAHGWLAASAGTSEVPPPDLLDDLSRRIAEARRDGRPALLRRAAAGRVGPETLGHKLLALRWVDRMAYHLARAAHHLREEPSRVVEEATGDAPMPALEEPS